MTLPDHERFLSEVALTVPPPALGAAATLLTGRGETMVAPGSDPTLHPMVVPLTRSPVDGEVTGLLRWPGAGGGGSKLPFVRTEGRQLRLLANCVEHFVAREAVVTDADGASDAPAAAQLAASTGFELTPGAAAAAPGGLQGFLLTKVGPFTSGYESLARGHLERGSASSALIACERSQACFSAWGRPFAFHSELLEGERRGDEARDLARHALSLPLWTLDYDVPTLTKRALSSVEHLTQTCRHRADGGLPPEVLRAQNFMDKRSATQVSKDKASFLLDLCVVAPDEYTYESTRDELVRLYREAQLSSFADFIEAGGR